MTDSTEDTQLNIQRALEIEKLLGHHIKLHLNHIISKFALKSMKTAFELAIITPIDIAIMTGSNVLTCLKRTD